MKPADEARHEHASDAAVKRMWTHAIGILNRALVTPGRDPVSGLPATEWGAPGTGLAGSWQGQHFILTAEHVLEKANVQDLRFFARPIGSLQRVSASDLGTQDIIEAKPLKDDDAAIHRCEWEDLALITVSAHAFGPYLEFVDLLNIRSVHPEEGALVIGLGYPVSSAPIFDNQRGREIQKAVMLCPIPFGGDVLKAATGRYFNNFDSESHYQIPYEGDTVKHPGGVSGSAAWVQDTETPLV